MAGWTNSSGSGSGGGRGSGGRGGFTTRRYSNNPFDMVHGGTSGSGGSGSGRWRGGDRSSGGPPPLPHYRYRPVDAVYRHSPPVVSLSSEMQQVATSSASSRHAQVTHPISTTDKSSASGTAAPPSTRDPDDKASRNAANFECNVCFDIASEPVVTKCGHLFCWECLYQWLHVHSRHRECPVCKGQVADDAIIPIYGRGGSAASVDNAPPRPTGARVESSRQQQQQQQQQLPTFPRPSIFGDEEELTRIFNFGRRPRFIEDLLMSVPPGTADLDMEDYDSDQYDMGDIDEFYEYDYHLMGVPVFGSSAGTEAGNPNSSLAHADMINIRENIVGGATGVYHHQEFGYGANPHNSRGRRGRRNRARASADHSTTDGMVMGGSDAFYRDNGGSSSVSAGGGFRPHNGSWTDVAIRPSNSGWTERRGRNNRNSNSGGGRGGMQDSRRQRTHYNC